MKFSWYERIENSNDLQQGDIIKDCQVLIPPKRLELSETQGITIKEIDVIIMTQSCDLGNNKVEIVLVSPVYTLTDFLDGLPSNQYSSLKSKRKVIEQLKKGFINGYHLLNKQIPDITDFLVVDFKNVYGVQYDFLIDLAIQSSPRIRLLPPYREHLSQAFARYFMRVGLPSDIDTKGYI